MPNIMYRPEMNNPVLSDVDLYGNEIVPDNTIPQLLRIGLENAEQNLTPYDITPPPSVPTEENLKQWLNENNNTIRNNALNLTVGSIGKVGKNIPRAGQSLLTRNPIQNPNNPYLNYVRSKVSNTPPRQQNVIRTLTSEDKMRELGSLLNQTIERIQPSGSFTSRNPFISSALASLGTIGGLGAAIYPLVSSSEPLTEAETATANAIADEAIKSQRVRDIGNNNRNLLNMLPNANTTTSPTSLSTSTTSPTSDTGYTPPPRQTNSSLSVNYTPDTVNTGYTNDTWTRSNTARNNPLNERTANGGYKAYNSLEDGVRGNWGLLQRYQDNHGLTNARDILARWSGASGKKLDNYVSSITKKAGIDPNARIDLHDPAIAAKLISAMTSKSGNALSEKDVLAMLGGSTKNTVDMPTAPSRQITKPSGNPYLPNMDLIYQQMRDHNFLRG